MRARPGGGAVCHEIKYHVGMGTNWKQQSAPRTMRKPHCVHTWNCHRRHVWERSVAWYELALKLPKHFGYETVSGWIRGSSVGPRTSSCVDGLRQREENVWKQRKIQARVREHAGKTHIHTLLMYAAYVTVALLTFTPGAISTFSNDGVPRASQKFAKPLLFTAGSQFSFCHPPRGSWRET